MAVDPQTTNENITAAGLAPLEGEPDRVRAAEPIRLALLGAADDWMSALRSQERKAPLLPMDSPPEDVEQAEAALLRLRRQRSAEWWLAHAGAEVGELLGAGGEQANG